MKFSGVKILQGVEISIFLLIFEWALQQCNATALPVINTAVFREDGNTKCDNSVAQKIMTAQGMSSNNQVTVRLEINNTYVHHDDKVTQTK